MPLFISSCEKAPIHRCGAERSYIHSLFLKENVKEKETPEPLRAYALLNFHQRTALYPIFWFTKDFATHF